MESVFKVFRHGLQKTKTSLLRGIRGAFSEVSGWDEDSYEELEAALIATDLGVDISVDLVDTIRNHYERGLISTADDIVEVARKRILDELVEGERADCSVVFNDDGPTVILLVGVNGSGKTTTAAKLAHLWTEDGKSVLMAAADTFRAGAVEQLKIWGERAGCPVIAGTPGGDPGAVTFDAVKAGLRRGSDVVLIDTAGRQHTRGNLMRELAKIRRVAYKACSGAPHHVWLTVDASTGTNALIQAREFGKLCKVDGLVLTKLDGTGKGGMVVAIRRELGLPVHFVGLGEKMTDLQPFEPGLFTRALFDLA